MMRGVFNLGPGLTEEDPSRSGLGCRPHVCVRQFAFHERQEEIVSFERAAVMILALPSAGYKQQAENACTAMSININKQMQSNRAAELSQSIDTASRKSSTRTQWVSNSFEHQQHRYLCSSDAEVSSVCFLSNAAVAGLSSGSAMERLGVGAEAWLVEGPGVGVSVTLEAEPSLGFSPSSSPVAGDLPSVNASSSLPRTAPLSVSV